MRVRVSSQKSVAAATHATASPSVRGGPVTPSSQALYAKSDDVVHRHRLLGIEGLAVAAADQRPVVAVLRLDQGIEVLSRGKDLAGGLRALELTGVTADRFQLPGELGRDVHNERGLHRVLPIRQRVQDLVGAVRLPLRWISRQAGEVAGV